jgi:hypothetical protein
VAHPQEVRHPVLAGQLPIPAGVVSAAIGAMDSSRGSSSHSTRGSSRHIPELVPAVVLDPVLNQQA